MKYALALKTVNSNMTAYEGFKWKKRGIVTAPDWNKKPECGGGLHALLWGVGDGRLLSWDNDAKWLVLAVPVNSWVDLGGKIKFPKCRVVFCGNRKDATDYIIKHGAEDKPVVGCYKTGGYHATLTGGYYATLVWRIWENGIRRIHTVYVGENGIKPNVKYRWNGKEAEEVKYP